MIRTTSPRPAFGKRAKAPAVATSSPRTARVPVLGSKLPALARLERLNAEARAEAAIRAEWEGPRPAFRSLDGIAARLERSRARKARDNRTLAGIVAAVAALAFASAYAGSLLTAGPASTYALVVVDSAGDAYTLDSGLSAEDCRTGLSAGMFCERETR